MTELINFPDGTVQHAYLTTDNANDDLEIAALDGDLVILDTNENPVLRWDASATQWDFVSQDMVGVGSFATDGLNIGTADFVDSGDLFGAFPTITMDDNESTTSTSYVSTGARVSIIWNDWMPANAQIAIVSIYNISGVSTSGDARLRNTVDSETIHESTNFTSTANNGPTNYEPTTTASRIVLEIQFRTDDGGASSDLLTDTVSHLGVQV